VIPNPMVSLSNYLFMDIWIVKMESVHVLGIDFTYDCSRNPEMDSNFNWTGPPS
jgi:hypothetical protein